MSSRPDTADAGPSLQELILWVRRHALMLAIFALVCGPIAWFIASRLPLEYTAAVQIMPSQPATASTLSGLIGLPVSQSGGNETQIGLAWLQSRNFLERFILDNRMVEPLLPDLRLAPPYTPEIREGAVGAFRKRLSVSTDKLTGATVVAVRARDPARAARWANGLVDRVNFDLRQRAMRRSLANRLYLSTQAEITQNAEMRQLLAALVAGELKTYMLARQPSGYGFEIIDPAVTPAFTSNLRPLFVGLAGAMLGLILGVAICLLADAARLRPTG